MTKTKKILATVAALGALAVSGVTFAAPAAAPAEVPAVQAPGNFFGPGCAKSHGVHYEALGRILTLQENQKPLWQAYVDSRLAMKGPMGKWDKPCVDTQDRLERQITRLEARTAKLKVLVKARADLLKVLSPEQKFVLEQAEFRHRGMRGEGPGARGPGFRHHVPHHGPHFGPGYGRGPNPECPWQKPCPSLKPESRF